MADGGSDDTVDGVTDHEDVHTEDDMAHTLASPPHENTDNDTGHACSYYYQRHQRHQLQQQQQANGGGRDYGVEAVGVNAVGGAGVGGARAAHGFRRRGWSSSRLTFSDVDGRRRAREDVAVRITVVRVLQYYCVLHSGVNCILYMILYCIVYGVMLLP